MKAKERGTLEKCIEKPRCSYEYLPDEDGTVYTCGDEGFKEHNGFVYCEMHIKEYIQEPDLPADTGKRGPSDTEGGTVEEVDDPPQAHAEDTKSEENDSTLEVFKR